MYSTQELLVSIDRRIDIQKERDGGNKSLLLLVLDQILQIGKSTGTKIMISHQLDQLLGMR